MSQGVWPIVIAIASAVFAASLSADRATPARSHFTFDFGTAAPAAGHSPVSSTTTYSKDLGYGFIEPSPPPGAAGALEPTRSSVCARNAPFLFGIDLPQGNYTVTVTLGDVAGSSVTTLKAEARRLILERVETQSGELATRTFTVNVRNATLGSGGTVRLKPDEQGHADWDDRLTLEFNDARPCVSSLDIASVDDAVTVYLAGDSTVTDQPREPWSAWGQMLPRFFGPGVAVANHAESGEAMISFIRERRFEKVLDSMKAGDYLFVQFAHNDQKPGNAHLDAFTTYKEHLALFVKEARVRGAIPVLVTSMHRRVFDENGRVQNTLADYPDAMRQAAVEQHVPLIDLNAMSKVLYEALGPAESRKAFVHYPAGTFPGQTADLKDDSHFNAYGAYELAKCVVRGIRDNALGLAAFLAKDVPAFDPSRPDPVREWSLPLSPMRAVTSQGR